MLTVYILAMYDVHVCSELMYSFNAQNGCSPLYVASQEGHIEVVDTLLKSGANPNQATTVCVLFTLSMYTVC